MSSSLRERRLVITDKDLVNRDHALATGTDDASPSRRARSRPAADRDADRHARDCRRRSRHCARAHWRASSSSGGMTGRRARSRRVFESAKVVIAPMRRRVRSGLRRIGRRGQLRRLTRRRGVEDLRLHHQHQGGAAADRAHGRIRDRADQKPLRASRFDNSKLAISLRSKTDRPCRKRPGPARATRHHAMRIGPRKASIKTGACQLIGTCLCWRIGLPVARRGDRCKEIEQADDATDTSVFVDRRATTGLVFTLPKRSSRRVAAYCGQL